MNVRYAALLFSMLLVTACSEKDKPKNEDSIATSAALSPTQNAGTTAVPVPEEEPSDAVVRELMFEEYRELEKAGGLPVTATATGQNLTIRAKLFDARKEKCTPSPQDPPGWYECELTITLSLATGGKDPANKKPSEQGARIGVKWDPSGKWVAQ